MNQEQKKSLIREMFASASKVFETIAGVNTKIVTEVGKTSTSVKSVITEVFNSVVVTVNGYTDAMKTAVNADLVTLDTRVTDSEARLNSNGTDIVNISKLGTDVGTYKTWDELLLANNAGPGDSAELSVRDGDHPPGLYRFGATTFNTDPYINYEEANAVDEPLSQADIDAIVGV